MYIGTYAIISAQHQIDNLEGSKLKDGIKFFYALFFKSKNYSRENLLIREKCVLYLDKGVVCCGNKENIPINWNQVSYGEFRELISA